MSEDETKRDKTPAFSPASEPEGSDATESDTYGRFPIVAIGASAGGLESMELLLSRVQPCGMALLVLQHLPAERSSSLKEILARTAHVPVLLMQDGAKIEPDHVYVAPPSVEVLIERGHVRLQTRPEHSLGQQSIDLLFRSLARDQGATAIAVVLSGAGSDGSVGIRAIKEEGGITFVQEPETAGQPGMPQSAIDSGFVDFRLDAAAIGDQLMLLGARPSTGHRRPTRRLNPDSLQALFSKLQQLAGVDFSAYKLNTVQRRIDRRMMLARIERPIEYVKFVEESPDELRALYGDLLIGVTGFFRDQEPFEALKNEVLPRMLADRPSSAPIRVWVPGCATGEEAYSIMICLLETLEKLGSKHSIQLFATDIDENALAKARHGVYPEGITLDVSPERLQRFFGHAEKGYQISRQVRDMVLFARHNLGKDPPFSRLDLISCRNVLIYLQPALQKKVMRVFHYALAPRGHLLLGSAESVGEASDLFSLLDRKHKLYVKKDSSSPGIFDFTYGQQNEGGATVMSAAPNDRKPEVSLQQLADRKILDRYAPPGVLVDANLNILQFRGQTGAFLAPSPGAATLNVLRMIRPDLLVSLKGTLQRALDEGMQVSCDAVTLLDGSNLQVIMDVIPVDASGCARCLLVLFRSVPVLRGDATQPGDPRTPGPNEQQRVHELERELVTTKDYLETLIQELATSNEELQSSNEELQSANEELQSTNEELETSKEELQASNEELATVNEELQMRIAQLGIVNDDLVNVLATASTPLFLVSLDLRIRRFSSAAEQLLKLVPADIGRPISYLATHLDVPHIETVVRQAIDSMQAKELQLRSWNGHWYTMRISLYQTAERAIRGVVIELLPLGALSKSLSVPELPELVGKVLSTLPDTLVVVDPSLRMVWMNEAFQKRHGSEAAVLGEPLESLLPRDEAMHTLWEKIEAAVYTGRTFEGLTVESRQVDGMSETSVWSARCIAAEGQRAALVILSIRG